MFDQAISQRCQYIPNIARSLINVQQRASSTRLRMKTCSLTKFKSGEVSLLEDSDFEDPGSERETLFAAAETSVWIAMQSNLKDLSACQFLKHLNPVMLICETEEERLKDCDMLFDEDPLCQDSLFGFMGPMPAAGQPTEGALFLETDVLVEGVPVVLQCNDEVESEMLMSSDFAGGREVDEDVDWQSFNEIDERESVFEDLFGEAETLSERMLFDEEEAILGLCPNNNIDDLLVEEEVKSWTEHDAVNQEWADYEEDMLII